MIITSAPIKRRIIQYIELQNIIEDDFFENIGVSVSKLIESNFEYEVESVIIVDVLAYYNDINPNWLLLGKGEMLLNNETFNVIGRYDKFPTIFRLQEAIKYYCDLYKDENYLLILDSIGLNSKSINESIDILLFKYPKFNPNFLYGRSYSLNEYSNFSIESIDELCDNCLMLKSSNFNENYIDKFDELKISIKILNDCHDLLEEDSLNFFL